jgi:putative transposase
MGTVAKSMGFEIIEFNGESDHVHLLIEYPPKLSISTLVNHLKGVSSRMYRQKGFNCPHDVHLWSPSYFAVSVGGAPLAVLKEYIKNQKSP